MNWTFTDDRPIWLQISELITHGIVSGEFPAGAKLPSVRELAQASGVNPNTMQRALVQLEAEGLAHSNRTAGRVVTEDCQLIETTRRTLAQAHISEYLSAMAKLGYETADAIALLEE